MAFGCSHRTIAKKLGRHHSSIDREVRRSACATDDTAQVAHAVYKARRQRPSEVKDRSAFGHWELDSMVSSRGESKGCFATFVERKTPLYTALKTPDRTAASMEAAITALYHALPAGALKAGTTDRGKEFACCANVKQKLGLTLYFGHAYSSWQRGSNENSNGRLREFYPKKADLALVKQDELTHNLFLINSRPRKCLGWKSPIQVFLHEVAHFT